MSESGEALAEASQGGSGTGNTPTWAQSNTKPGSAPSRSTSKHSQKRTDARADDQPPAATKRKSKKRTTASSKHEAAQEEAEEEKGPPRASRASQPHASAKKNGLIVAGSSASSTEAQPSPPTAATSPSRKVHISGGDPSPSGSASPLRRSSASPTFTSASSPGKSPNKSPNKKGGNSLRRRFGTLRSRRKLLMSSSSKSKESSAAQTQTPSDSQGTIRFDASTVDRERRKQEIEAELERQSAATGEHVAQASGDTSTTATTTATTATTARKRAPRLAEFGRSTSTSEIMAQMKRDQLIQEKAEDAQHSVAARKRRRNRPLSMLRSLSTASLLGGGEDHLLTATEQQQRSGAATQSSVSGGGGGGSAGAGTGGAVSALTEVVADSLGQSELHILAHEGDKAALLTLLAVPGVKVNVRDHCGWTPLHYAANAANLYVCKSLLLKGADACARTSDTRDTALHFVASIESAEMHDLPIFDKVLHMLMDRGARVHALNRAGDSPLSLCERRGHIYTASKLRALCRADDLPDSQETARERRRRAAVAAHRKTPRADEQHRLLRTSSPLGGAAAAAASVSPSTSSLAQSSSAAGLADSTDGAARSHRSSGTASRRRHRSSKKKEDAKKTAQQEDETSSSSRRRRRHRHRHHHKTTRSRRSRTEGRGSRREPSARPTAASLFSSASTAESTSAIRRRKSLSALSVRSSGASDHVAAADLLLAQHGGSRECTQTQRNALINRPPPALPFARRFKSNKLTPVRKLILRLFNERYLKKDPEYVDDFLVTHRLFIAPEYLLEQLFAIHKDAADPTCDVHGKRLLPARRSGAELSLGAGSSTLVFTGKQQRRVLEVRSKVMDILRKWLKYYLPDLQQRSRFLDLLVPFVASASACEADELEATAASHDLKKVLTRCLQRVFEPDLDQLPGSRIDLVSPKVQSFLEMDAGVLAEQLTLMEARAFASVQPLEFPLYLSAVPAPDGIDRSALLESCSALQALEQEQERLARWIATEVVMQPTAEERAAVLEHWIRVAVKCRALHNYRTSALILRTLISPDLARLKRTWLCFGPRARAAFEELLECEGKRVGLLSDRARTLVAERRGFVPDLEQLRADLRDLGKVALTTAATVSGGDGGGDGGGGGSSSSGGSSHNLLWKVGGLSAAGAAGAVGNGGEELSAVASGVRFNQYRNFMYCLRMAQCNPLHITPDHQVLLYVRSREDRALPFTLVAAYSLSCESPMGGKQQKIALDKYERNITYILRDNVLYVQAASLDKLVEKLVATRFIGLDPHFVGDFLLTHRYFITPTELLRRLIKYFDRPPTPAHSVSRPQFTRYVTERALQRSKVMEVMSEWVRGHFADLKADDEFVRTFVDSVQRLQMHSDDEVFFFLNVKASLVNRAERRALLEHRQLQAATQSFELEDATFTEEMLFQRSFPREAAPQLALLDYALFRKITPKELLRRGYGDDQRSNVRATMTERFNLMSGWVASRILACEDVEKRADMLRQLIRLSWECMRLNNFNTSYAILAGLNSTAISRLRRTWSRVSHRLMERFRELERLFDFKQNHRNYRVALQTKQPPLIPFLGIYTKDIFTIDENNPDFTERGVVNFEKFSMLVKVIREVLQYQATPYSGIAENQQLRGYLSQLRVDGDEETRYQRSVELEPLQGASMADSGEASSPRSALGSSALVGSNGAHSHADADADAEHGGSSAHGTQSYSRRTRTLRRLKMGRSRARLDPYALSPRGTGLTTPEVVVQNPLFMRNVSRRGSGTGVEMRVRALTDGSRVVENPLVRLTERQTPTVSQMMGISHAIGEERAYAPLVDVHARAATSRADAAATAAASSSSSSAQSQLPLSQTQQLSGSTLSRRAGRQSRSLNRSRDKGKEEQLDEEERHTAVAGPDAALTPDTSKGEQDQVLTLDCLAELKQLETPEDLVALLTSRSGHSNEDHIHIDLDLDLVDTEVATAITELDELDETSLAKTKTAKKKQERIPKAEEKEEQEEEQKRSSRSQTQEHKAERSALRKSRSGHRHSSKSPRSSSNSKSRSTHRHSGKSPRSGQRHSKSKSGHGHSSKSPHRSKSKSPPHRHSKSKSPPHRHSKSKSPPHRHSKSKSPPHRHSKSKSPPHRHSKSKSRSKKKKTALVRSAATVGRQSSRRRKRSVPLTGSRSESHVSSLASGSKRGARHSRSSRAAEDDPQRTTSSGHRLSPDSRSPRRSNDLSRSNSFDRSALKENTAIVPLGEDQLAALAVADLKDTFEQNDKRSSAHKKERKRLKRQKELDRKSAKLEKLERAERDRAERKEKKVSKQQRK